MDRDVIAILLLLGGLVLAFILIALVMQFLQRKLTRWNEISEVFPVREITQDIKFFKRCPGQAGRMNFSGRRSGGFRIGFTPEGIMIRLGGKKYRDLLVPWYKIRSATKYSLGSRTAVKVIIDSKVPLSFYLSKDAMIAFETRYKDESKSLESLIHDHRPC